MERCETCRWWRQNAAENGDCESPKVANNEAMFAHDYETCTSCRFDGAHILVVPIDFGCVWHEAR